MRTPMPELRDTRPVECRFFDRDDKFVGAVSLAPASGPDRRELVFRGKVYKEGDGSGFYGPNEFAEIVEEARH